MLDFPSFSWFTIPIFPGELHHLWWKLHRTFLVRLPGGLSPHRSGPRQRADCQCAADLARGNRAGRGPGGPWGVWSSSELWVLPCEPWGTMGNHGEPWGTMGNHGNPKKAISEMGIEGKSKQDVTNNLGESERAHHNVTTNGLLARGRTSKMT